MPPDPATVSPEQRAALDAYITELDSLKGTPPPAPPERPAPVSDDQWASMTDRARENWVASTVGWVLDDLAKLDADRRRDADLEALKNMKPEPEKPPEDKPPAMIDKVRKFLWGEQK